MVSDGPEIDLSKYDLRDEIVTSKELSTVGVGVGDGEQHGDPDDGRNAEPDQHGRLALVFGSQGSSAEGSYHLNGAERHVEENRGESASR